MIIKNPRNAANSAAFLFLIFFISTFFLGQSASAQNSKAPAPVPTPTLAPTIAKKTKTVTSTSEIENLLLQKKRPEALKILSASFRDSSETERPDLYELYLKASRVFLMDRNQQLYESALQQKKSDLPAAQRQLSESLASEAGHIGLQLEQFRLLILTGECKQAATEADVSRKVISFDEELNLTRAFAHHCQNVLTIPILHQLKSASFRIQKDIIWLTLEGLMAGKKKKLSEAVLADLKKMSTSYPETDYLLWKQSLVSKVPKISLATKYLEACKTVSSRQLRQWIADPYLCSRTDEVEIDLGKLNRVQPVK